MQATDLAPQPEDLYTINAGGFSATADAFARDPDSCGLWFLSMLGSQTAVKAIWAALLKQPPDLAHIIKGADGMALSGGYQRCVVPRETVGTWTTKVTRLPVSGGWHALVYTTLAEFGSDHDELPAAGPERGGGAGAPPPVPRPAQPPAAAPLLGGVAVGAGAPEGGDRPPPVRGGLGLPLQPQRRVPPGRPLRRPWRREG